jgi:hypothetical protein
MAVNVINMLSNCDDNLWLDKSPENDGLVGRKKNKNCEKGKKWYRLKVFFNIPAHKVKLQ